ncbi:MAG: methyltransferase domain-containing protein, partial [Burkholderiales bacterium]
SLLDYGCGSMDFSRRLREEGVINKFVAMDTYAAPDNLEGVECWKDYRQIHDGILSDLRESFDVAIIIDVLHHADESEQPTILAALGNTAGRVVVKDHFEFGYVSRQMLRLADWFGNFAYGVRIPKRYFDKQSWPLIVRSSGLVEVARVENVKVHSGLFGVLLPRHHHFISILASGAAPSAQAPKNP